MKKARGKTIKGIIVVLAVVTALFGATNAVHAQTNVRVVLGDTYHHTVAASTTDTSTLLTAAIDAALGVSVDYTKCKAIIITSENNDYRIAFGTTTVKGASPVGHVRPVGSADTITSQSDIRSARIISKTAGAPALLMISLEY